MLPSWRSCFEVTEYLKTFSFQAKGTPELGGNLSDVFLINVQFISIIFVTTFKVTGSSGGIWG